MSNAPKILILLEDQHLTPQKAADLHYPASTHFVTAGPEQLSVTEISVPPLGTVGTCLQTKRSSGSKL